MSTNIQGTRERDKPDKSHRVWSSAVFLPPKHGGPPDRHLFDRLLMFAGETSPVLSSRQGVRDCILSHRQEKMDRGDQSSESVTKVPGVRRPLSTLSRDSQGDRENRRPGESLNTLEGRSGVRNSYLSEEME